MKRFDALFSTKQLSLATDQVGDGEAKGDILLALLMLLLRIPLLITLLLLLLMSDRDSLDDVENEVSGLGEAR